MKSGSKAITFPSPANNNMEHYFETERLIIRNFQDSDLNSFHAYRNDPEVAKYQGWKLPLSLDRAQDFIERVKTIPLGLLGEHYQLAIEIKKTGEMIGDVAYWSTVNDARLIMIGYSIASPHWMQGYASEATTRLLDFIFYDLQAHRVSADCDTNNTGSYRLLEKLGFRREAHFRESFWMDTYWGDEYYYGILDREWKARRQGVESASAD